MYPLAHFALALSLCAGAVNAQQNPSDTTTSALEELVVVASRLPVETHTTGHQIAVLDQTTISDLGYEYAAELFRFVPGAAVSRAGGYGGLAQLRLRGAEANHSVVLIDGIDVTAAGTGEFDFSSLLSADIERIEVLRGPQSGLYGSNALAGVVSIHTKQPGQGLGADFHLEGGENNTRHTAASISGGHARVQGRLSYVQRRSEFDLSTNDAVIGSEDDEDDNRTISGQLHAAVSETLSIKLYGRRTDKDTDTDGFDFSGGPEQGLPIDDLSFSDTQDQTLGAVASLKLADQRMLARITVEQADNELDGGTFGSESDREQLRLDGSWQWGTAGSLAQRTTLFLQYEEESFRNLYPTAPSQVPTQDRDLFGYGVEHRMAFNDRLFLNGTIRRDDNDDFADETTYSVDVSYLLNERTTRLHASLGRGVTNPTFFEQFGFVPGSFVGNPDLKPEQSTGWDAGVEQTFFAGSLLIDLTYFDADLEDEIQSLFPSVRNVDGDSDRRGIELSGSWQPSPDTSLNFTYTYTDADEPSGEEVLRPEHSGSLSIARQMLDGRLRLAGNVVFNGEQLDNDFRNFFSNGFVTERTELDSFTVVNLNASYAVTDALQIYVRLENLFDEDYEQLLGYATPGRAAFAGVRFRLGG